MHKLAFASLAVASLAVGGCSYAPYAPLHMPEQPLAAPADVEHKDGFFEGVAGTKLYEQSWRPRGEPKAVVVIVHGLKDHSTRYKALAERLAQQGFAVHAFDLRGHGRSEGLRVWLGSFDEHLGDLEIFWKRVAEAERGKPVLLFGHSMGGAIATLYTITRKPALNGLVLSGAALAVDVPGAVVGGTKLVAALAPAAGVFQLDLKQFSRDQAVIDEGSKDPLVFQDGAAAKTAASLLGAIGQIQERMGEVSVPLLAMHGEADKNHAAGREPAARRALSVEGQDAEDLPGPLSRSAPRAGEGAGDGRRGEVDERSRAGRDGEPAGAGEAARGAEDDDVEGGGGLLEHLA
ncbi:MAG: alpha/beta hydrolase [Minicystis sp.]